MKARKRKCLHLTVLTCMLLGLPLFGIWMSGKPVSPYLEFPPETLYIEHASFSGVAFFGYTLFIIGTTAPFIFRFLRVRGTKTASRPVRRFPWWGWAGLILGACAWGLAWSRSAWFSELQVHTFTPLWIGYIVTINALTYRRTGRCWMTERPKLFLLHFPASAIFWWFFEYLNRFVQNWYYVGSRLDAWTYFWYATLPFSSVLPAVLSTRQWLLSFSWPEKKFGRFLPVNLRYPKAGAWMVLIAAGAGLAGIGVYPNNLFPLLWISPLLIIVSIQTLAGEPHVFSDLRKGDWSRPLSAALAALICGFFWEMWNVFSFAKWQYNVPYVHRFEIFEMPLLGYAGYLPFGFECAAISIFLFGRWAGPGGRLSADKLPLK